MADDLQPVTEQFAKLCDIVTKLRAPGGCPWDREQTNESLLPALIEEASWFILRGIGMRDGAIAAALAATEQCPFQLTPAS